MFICSASFESVKQFERIAKDVSETNFCRSNFEKQANLSNFFWKILTCFISFAVDLYGLFNFSLCAK